jgi:hypothetical protein
MRKIIPLFGRDIGMGYRSGLILIFIMLLFFFYTCHVYGESDQAVNLKDGSSNQNKIFSFSGASSSAEFKTVNASVQSGYLNKNLSVEERYNRMSREMADTVFHAGADGEQIVCIQCVPIPS